MLLVATGYAMELQPDTKMQIDSSSSPEVQSKAESKFAAESKFNETFEEKVDDFVKHHPDIYKCIHGLEAYEKYGEAWAYRTFVNEELPDFEDRSLLLAELRRRVQIVKLQVDKYLEIMAKKGKDLDACRKVFASEYMLEEDDNYHIFQKSAEECGISNMKILLHELNRRKLFIQKVDRYLEVMAAKGKDMDECQRIFAESYMLEGDDCHDDYHMFRSPAEQCGFSDTGIGDVKMAILFGELTHRKIIKQKVGQYLEKVDKYFKEDIYECIDALATYEETREEWKYKFVKPAAECGIPDTQTLLVELRRRFKFQVDVFLKNMAQKCIHNLYTCMDWLISQSKGYGFDVEATFSFFNDEVYIGHDLMPPVPGFNICARDPPQHKCGFRNPTVLLRELRRRVANDKPKVDRFLKILAEKGTSVPACIQWLKDCYENGHLRSANTEFYTHFLENPVDECGISDRFTLLAELQRREKVGDQMYNKFSRIWNLKVDEYVQKMTEKGMDMQACIDGAHDERDRTMFAQCALSCGISNAENLLNVLKCRVAADKYLKIMAERGYDMQACLEGFESTMDFMDGEWFGDAGESGEIDWRQPFEACGIRSTEFLVDELRRRVEVGEIQTFPKPRMQKWQSKFQNFTIVK